MGLLPLTFFCINYLELNQVLTQNQKYMVRKMR